MTFVSELFTSILFAAVSFVHPDHLNTPQKMTDASQAIVWNRQQQPFGEDSRDFKIPT